MPVALLDVTVRLGGRTLLDGVSVGFEDAAMTAVIGPSGSGKSTLLSAISGLRGVDSGTVHAPGRIEWLIQSTPLFMRRSALENVIASATYRGVPRRLALRRGVRAMRVLGIGHLCRIPVHRLSGGERQRVAVARAMTSRAGVVLADEPTASLDASARGSVCDALAAAARAGAAVIVATHDPYVAARCDGVYALTDGALRRSTGS